jgi:hypothetical protein
MEMVIPVPEGFVRRAADEGTLWVAPDGSWALFVTPLVASRPEPLAWMRRAAGHESSAGAAVELEEPRSEVTEDGWPMTLLEARVGAEQRLVAYLQALDYGGGVVVRARPEAAPGWRATALALLAKARPDFSGGGVACLAHLLDGLAEVKASGAVILE